jgi:hypothetical protein
MVQYYSEGSLPKDVTFFIGPVGAPPEAKKYYERAVALSKEGDNEPLEEILNIIISSLSKMASDTYQEPSQLKNILEAMIDSEIGEFSTFVAKGYIRKTWMPTITIHLDRLKAPDGCSLRHLVKKSHGECIAATLGITLKADWIYTSWAYPGTPIDISPSRHLQTVKGA